MVRSQQQSPTRSTHTTTLPRKKQGRMSNRKKKARESLEELLNKEKPFRFDETAKTVDTCVDDDDDDASLDLSSLERDRKPSYRLEGTISTSSNSTRSTISSGHTSFSSHWDESEHETNLRRQRLERMREERDMQQRMANMNMALEEANKKRLFGRSLNQFFPSNLRPNLGDVPFPLRASSSLNDIEGPFGLASAFGSSMTTKAKQQRKTLMELGGGSMRDLFTIPQDEVSTECDQANNDGNISGRPGPFSRLMAKRNNFNQLKASCSSDAAPSDRENASPPRSDATRRFADLGGDEAGEQYMYASSPSPQDEMQDSASSLPSLGELGAADDFEVSKNGRTRHRNVSPPPNRRKWDLPTQAPAERPKSSAAAGGARRRRAPRPSRVVQSTVSHEIAKGLEERRRRGRSPKSPKRPERRRRTKRSASPSSRR